MTQAIQRLRVLAGASEVEAAKRKLVGSIKKAMSNLGTSPKGDVSGKKQLSGPDKSYHSTLNTLMGQAQAAKSKSELNKVVKAFQAARSGRR